jgi:hypothetical protein
VDKPVGPWSWLSTPLPRSQMRRATKFRHSHPVHALQCRVRRVPRKLSLSPGPLFDVSSRGTLIAVAGATREAQRKVQAAGLDVSGSGSQETSAQKASVAKACPR